MRFASTLLILGLLLAALPAGADVPDSCVHPQVDPLLCAVETRLVHYDVLPSARVRALERLYERLAREAPLQDLERNLLLEEILETIRARRGH